MKKKDFNIRKVVIALLVLASIATLSVFLIFLYLDKNTTTADEFYKSYSSPDWHFSKKIEENLPSLIDELGIEEVIGLAERAEKEGLINFRECHPLYHLIGHAAWYRKTKDISYLTEKYALKCQSGFPHGVEAQITLEENDPVTRRQKLVDYCRECNTYYPGMSCFHGAGHAFYQKFLDEGKALKNCDTIKNSEFPNLNTCYDGVFSEAASRVFGIDGETGGKIPGETKQIDAGSRPLTYCYQFEEKYQDSCFTNLAPIVAAQTKDPDDIRPCIYEEYTDVAQYACIRYLASGRSREKLLAAQSFRVPSVVTDLSPESQREYAKGVASVIFAYARNHEEKDWKKICDTFDPEVVDDCYSEVQTVLEANLLLSKKKDSK